MRCLCMIAGISAGLVLSALAPAAAAQQQPIPPEHYTLDPRGVDLVSGTFNHGAIEVVIGQPGAGGLVYGRSFVSGWRDNLIGGLSFNGMGDFVASVGPISEPFVWGGTGYVSKYDNGSMMELVGGEWHVTDRHGNQAVFNIPMAIGGENPYGAAEGLLTSWTTPAGEVVTFTYQQGARGTGPSTKVYRLSAVTNNRGYMLKYAYASDNDDDATWWRLTNVRGINLAIDWCSASANSCSSFTETWPSVTYGSFTSGTGIPQTATDEAGRVTTYAYSSSGAWAGIESVRYPGATADDVVIDYNLSTDLRVNRVTGASGQWNYAFSTSGSVQTTTATGPLNQELVVEVDTTIGRATSVTDALSNEWSWQYDADLRITRVTQPEGDYVEYDYDARSNLVETTWNPKSGSSLDPIVVSTQYPPLPCADIETCNKPEWTTDALGGVTDYEWDATTGQLLSVTLPAPAVSAARPQTRYIYDTFQARYHNSPFTYVNGSAISLPVGTSTCATGDPQTSPTPVCTTTANELVTAVVYPTTASPNNLLPVSVSRGSGATPIMAEVETTWTPQGDVLTVNGPLAGSADTTSYVYDVSDPRQRIGVIGPDPDGGGALLNRAQRLTYNGRGQVTLAETGTASGGVWANFSAILKSEVEYDSAAWFRPVVSRQLSAANAVSGVQQVSYDAAGRPSCTAIRMNPAEFSGLPSSACLYTTGGYGQDRILQTTYDDLGRVLTTTSGYGTSDALTESVAYTDNGRVESLTDGRGNVSILEYDGFDRIVKLRYPNATCCTASTTDYEQYGFDGFGRLKTSRDRAGQTTSYSWDLLGRATGIDAPSGAMDLVLTYDNLGRALTVTGNSQTITTAWDALSRQTRETGPLGSMAYTYDAAGRMTRVTWPDSFYVGYEHDLYGATIRIAENGATSGAAVLAQYAYDNLGGLVSIARADGAGVATSYGYDAFGRLNSLAQNPAGTTNDVTFGFSYNPADQIAGRTVSNAAYVWTPATGSTTYSLNGRNEVTAINSASVTYDSNQNATSINGNAYGYDATNRLTSATPSGGSAASFTFDPNDRLYQSSVSGVSTRYQYAGLQMVAEYDGAGTIVARHIPGRRLDDIAASWDLSSTSSVRIWPLADERGSVIARTASVTTINRYDEYGTPHTSNTGRFGYTGQAWMPEAGAWNYRARAYLPGTGRFLQTDPIGYAAGANLYAYVGADPVNLVDPTGLQWLEICRTIIYPVPREPGVPQDNDSNYVIRCRYENSGLGSYFGYTPTSGPVMDDPAFAPYQAERLQAIHDNQWMVWVVLAPEAAVGLAETGAVLSARAVIRACNCFEADTLVRTENGLTPLQDIEVGDLVLSRDEATGETDFKPVVALIDGAERPIWSVTVETIDAGTAARRETIGTTDEHPWRLVGGDWATTAELYPGAELVTADGRRTIVVSVGQTDRVERTYNIEVEGFHTYFVGEVGVWVHNACRPFDFPRSVKNLIRALTPNCANCGARTIWGIRDVRGVTPSPLRSEVHHRVPGVGRGVSGGVNLCRVCHRLEHQ